MGGEIDLRFSISDFRIYVTDGGEMAFDVQNTRLVGLWIFEYGVRGCGWIQTFDIRYTVYEFRGILILNMSPL